MNPFVLLSPRANEELDGILNYLEASYGVVAAAECLDEIEKVCWNIAAFPFSCPAFKGKNIRKAVVNKHLSMFYQVKKDTIEVLTFWDNRRDGESLEI